VQPQPLLQLLLPLLPLLALQQQQAMEAAAAASAQAFLTAMRCELILLGGAHCLLLRL
jgi:hypothetical protein